jgi:predicted amidophosphoribosyltransferase
MQGDLVKLCPQCGSEYQMWVERCPDCDTPLVHGVEGQGAEVRAEGPGAEERPIIPPECVHLRTAAVDWLQRLSEDLDEAGIRHWATPPAWRRNPSLFVLPEDWDAAFAVDRERYAIEVPGVEDEEARPQRKARPRRREPSADDLEIKVCPSCGGEYQLTAETCVDCGVPLVRPWDLDSARESETPRVAAPAVVQTDDPGACPACGERLPEGAAGCPSCGLTLAQPDVCPNCGAELATHVGSCRRCGYEFFELEES